MSPGTVVSSWRSRVAFPLLAYAFTVIMMGTTVPTPMYALYSAKMHFSVLTTTAHDQRGFADMGRLPNVTTRGLIL